MDRPEPGLIRWSPDPRRNSFLHVNLQHSVVRLYEPIGHAQRGRFNYQKLSQHDDFPPLTTWDWSPASPGLVAVGTSNGVVNLLRVDDDANSYLELPLKMSAWIESAMIRVSMFGTWSGWGIFAARGLDFLT
jgi:WD repeat-containing protein mio